MPVYTPYPGPGRAISTAGLNKDQGWGSRTPGNQVIAGHEGEQGLNKTQGKSLVGLDTSGNPIITARSVTGITTTGATLNWTTTASLPNGVVRYRLAGSSGAYTTVNETGGPRTAHTVALSELTSNAVYDYSVTQPATAPSPNQVVFSGRLMLGVAMYEEPQGLQGTQQQLYGNPGGNGAGSPVGGGAAPASAPLEPPTAPTGPAAAPASGAATGFELSGLEATPEDATTVAVTWRTEAYADGLVRWDDRAGHVGEEWEQGNRRLNHDVLLFDLTPATTYSISVESTTAAGDTVAGGPVTATTPPAP